MRYTHFLGHIPCKKIYPRVLPPSLTFAFPPSMRIKVSKQCVIHQSCMLALTIQVVARYIQRTVQRKPRLASSSISKCLISYPEKSFEGIKRNMRQCYIQFANVLIPFLYLAKNRNLKYGSSSIKQHAALPIASKIFSYQDKKIIANLSACLIGTTMLEL